ncbi:hypothetical protein BBJ41_34410 [Burkholderia stabilis]|nr:hypothetical protein BBJ41_34410 [Burkholderia stabilis]
MGDVACCERREVTIEHRGNRIASVKPEVTPQVIGTQARVRDDRRETVGVVAGDGGIRVAHQPRVQRCDECRVFGWQQRHRDGRREFGGIGGRQAWKLPGQQAGQLAR